MSSNKIFSNENIDLLYGALKEQIAESLHYNISGREFRNQLVEIMNYKMKNSKPKSIMDFNKSVLDEAIPMFVHSIQNSRKSQQQQQQQYLVRQQGRMPPQPMATQNQQNEQQQQNDPRIMGSVNQMYDQLMQNRGNQNQGQQAVPNFQDPIPEDLPNVNDIYEYAEQNRSQTDIIPPPDPRQLAYMPPNLAQHVRQQPATYNNNTRGNGNMNGNMNQQIRMQNQMQMQNYIQNQLQQQNQQQFDNDKPNNNQQNLREGFHPQEFSNFTHTPPQMASVPEHADQLDFAEQANAMNDFDPKNDMGVPQPEQMRVLIPRTSRNLVHDSKMIPTIFTVDSRDRDSHAYSSASNYRIKIPEYKDVVSIELVSAEIPITGYVVNETNNLLHFQEDAGTTLIAEIPTGNYASDDLADAIKAAMELASTNGVTYTVTNDTTKNVYNIESDLNGGSIFTLIFFGGTEQFKSSNEINKKTETIYQPKSIGSIIGFDKVDLEGASNYTAQFRYNLGGEKYIMLHIEEAKLLESNQSSVHDAFAKIVIDEPLGNVKYYNRNHDNRFIKYFSPTRLISNLTISFRDYNGNLYNFNGHEHSLTLEIIQKDITKGPY